MHYQSILRIVLSASLAALLAACGGSNSSQSSATNSTANTAADSNSSAVITSANPNTDTAPVKPKGKLVAARNFATDTRKKDRDGIKGLQPILSRAPKTCKAASTLVGSGPKCEDFKKPEFFSVKNGNTWIDAQVFVPEHHEGDSLPVILHSHGWASKKQNKLVVLPKCEAKDKPYNCPLNKGSKILGIFDKINGLLTDFYNQGYIVVSFSQRGFGKSEGDITIMNPYLETQDAIAVVDWIAAQGKAGHLPINVDTNNDFKLGLIGGSYGGGFQFPLAALDSRVDAMIPVGTWNSLKNSLFPNKAVKGGWGNLLCVASLVNRRHPLLAKACTGMSIPMTRTTAELDTDGDLIKFISMNGLDYFSGLEKDNKPFQEGMPAFKMRPIDTLLVQGSRDVLFPLNEALNNYKYLKKAGGDVRILTNENGHINPMAGQKLGGSSHCGHINAFRAMRIWFDVKLRNADASLLNEIPNQCISLEEGKSVVLDSIPNLTAESTNTNLEANQWRPFDVSVGEIFDFDSIKCKSVYEVPADTNNLALAGQSWLRQTTVEDKQFLASGVAYVGLCIERDGKTILVDEAITALDKGSYQSATQFVAVGASLKAGDKVGVYASKTNGNMEFLSLTSVDNIFSTVGDLVQPEKVKELEKLQAWHKQNLQFFIPNAFKVQGEIKLPIVNKSN